MNGAYGHRTCPGCGAAVQDDQHRCVPERFVAHQSDHALPALRRLGEDLASWTAQRARTAAGSSSSVS
jgi:hypothetical protein